MLAAAEDAVAREIRTADEHSASRFAIFPWKDGRGVWRRALAKFPGASLYHREAWLDALLACYGLDLNVAVLHGEGELRAACVFANTRGLLSSRMVSLPFSDSGEPLARDTAARDELLRAILAARPARAFEVRGIACAAPWSNVECFLHWRIDLARSFDRIYSEFGRQVRTKARRARRENVQIHRGAGPDYVRRYYALQLDTRRRLGVPPQPLRFFAAIRESFSREGNCEIWLASHGGRDLAGLVLLRDPNGLYYKWGARAQDAVQGANHLLAATVIEEFAGKAAFLDLGRSDARNIGLNQFKLDLGAYSRPLPYAFFPARPRHISSESPNLTVKLARTLWRRLPLRVTARIGEILYRHLA